VVECPAEIEEGSRLECVGEIVEMNGVDLGMVGEMVEDSMVERMRQVFLVVKHEAGVPQELREQTHSDESLQPLFATSLGIHCVGMGKQLVVVLYVLVDAS
jgi:hypothetical protein